MDLKENFIFRLQQKSFLKGYILTGFLNLMSFDCVWELLELVYREHLPRAVVHS